MKRRSVLTGIGLGLSAGLTGCLSRDRDPPSEPTAPPTTTGKTATPGRLTSDDIAATFQVLGGHTPTDDTASAVFDDEQVTVTGTMDPSGCNRPKLGAVSYNSTDGIIHLMIGGESPYGPTATVECGNASFDYRSVLTTEGDSPAAVEVVHNYQNKDNRSFNLERG